MRGYAPGWQLRCPKCGRTVPAADVGMIRIGAWSRGKRTLARCSGCNGRFRWVHVERVPDDA